MYYFSISNAYCFWVTYFNWKFSSYRMIEACMARTWNTSQRSQFAFLLRKYSVIESRVVHHPLVTGTIPVGVNIPRCCSRLHALNHSPRTPHHYYQQHLNDARVRLQGWQHCRRNYQTQRFAYHFKQQVIRTSLTINFNCIVKI